MVAEAVLHCDLHMGAHGRFRGTVEAFAELLVDAPHGRERIGRQFGVRNVDEAIVAVVAPELDDAVGHSHEQLSPELTELRSVAGVRECPRELARQAGRRRDARRRIPVRHDESGIGVLRRQRLECDGMVRALELPTSAHAARLQESQHTFMPPVHRTVMDGAHPPRVRGDRVHQREAERHEVLRHRDEALDRQVGRIVVHRRDRGVELVEKPELVCSRGLEACVGGIGAPARWRNR